MIVHVEYRCPECDKVFNCPANLASHRRWHKPKVSSTTTKSSGGAGKAESGEDESSCSLCGKTFRKAGSLRKHLQSHCAATVDNNNGSAPATSPPSLKANKSYDIDQLLSPTKMKTVLRCAVCQETFQTSRELQDHCLEDCKRKEVKVKEEREEKEVSCSLCPNAKFSNMAGLAKHASKTHLVQRQQQYQQQQQQQSQLSLLPQLLLREKPASLANDSLSLSHQLPLLSTSRGALPFHPLHQPPLPPQHPLPPLLSMAALASRS